MAAQLEKALRVRKSLEQEVEKMSIENLRNSSRDNASYEEVHKRLCVIEREKEQALIKLESKETELRKFQTMYENDKEKNSQIIADFTEKSHRASRDLEKLSDEHAKVLQELDDIKKKLTENESEKDTLQKN